MQLCKKPGLLRCFLQITMVQWWLQQAYWYVLYQAFDKIIGINIAILLQANVRYFFRVTSIILTAKPPPGAAFSDNTLLFVTSIFLMV